RDGHLPFFEFCTLLVLDELAHLQFGGELLLVREPGGIDGREACDVVAAAGERFVDGAGRAVIEFGVVTLVIEIGGVFGIMLELVLPDLVEEARETAGCGAAGGNGGGSSRLRWTE